MSVETDGGDRCQRANGEELGVASRDASTGSPVKRRKQVRWPSEDGDVGCTGGIFFLRRDRWEYIR